MDMKTDVEELLRDGMERFTEEVRAPAGLAPRPRRLHRRRRGRPRRGGLRDGARRGRRGCGRRDGRPRQAAPARTRRAVTQARTAAYVMSRVKSRRWPAENLVFRGRTTSGDRRAERHLGVRPRSRFEEFTGNRLRSRAAQRGLHPPGRIRALPGHREPPASAGSSPASTSPTTTTSRACPRCPRPCRPARARRRPRLEMSGPAVPRPATGRPSSMRRSPAEPPP